VGEELCREGHEGPFCAVCSSGYYLDANSGTCKDCSDASAILSFFGLCVMLLLILALTAWCCWKKKERRNLQVKMGASQGKEESTSSFRGSQKEGLGKDRSDSRVSSTNFSLMSHKGQSYFNHSKTGNDYLDLIRYAQVRSSHHYS